MNFFERIDQYIDLDKSFFPQPWSKKSWQEQLNKDFFYIDEYNKMQKLKGFICWEYLPLESISHIYKVLVHPEERGIGVAEKNLRSSLDAMRLRHPEIQSAFLEVEVSNSKALALYEKLDFTVLERVKGFYGQNRDGLRMRRKF